MKHDPVTITPTSEEWETLPIDPATQEIMNKILEQNKMILEQNARIIAVLSQPIIIHTPVVTK
jgi:hypothetical protein